MTFTSAALVIASATTHAWWNFLLKRANGDAHVIGLSKRVEAIVLAPLFLYIGIGPVINAGRSAIALIAIGAALTLGNYAALALAYRRAPLSVAYPVSRSAALAAVAPISFALFGNRIDVKTMLGTSVIIVGVFLAAGGRSVFTRSDAPSGRQTPIGAAVWFAVLAGLCTAGYTVWDKKAVMSLSPFAYFYSYTAVVAVGYALMTRGTSPGTTAAATWKSHRSVIVQIALLNSTTYMLMLYALRAGSATNVLALRQISVAIGALLGLHFLREALSPTQLTGLAILVCGCAIVAIR